MEHCIRCRRERGLLVELKPISIRKWEEDGKIIINKKYKCRCGFDIERTIVLMDIGREKRAYTLGIEAGKADMPRIPAMDSKLLKECIPGNAVGESVPYLQAWLRGWDAAHAIRTEMTCRCLD